MSSKCWPRIGISFVVGLFFGVLTAFVTEIVDFTAALLWAKILQAFLSCVYIMAGFITIGRAYRDNKPIITEAIDHFLIGIASGISGVQLLLSGLPL
jgi:hypothetical protein